ncbi:MAG: sporulation protein YqfC [Sporolactobacillus sp.]|jgi:sporulation protein YqfC|nr:sporulation protein YqfC [Sporolactobacillus sp.]MCI1881539.1 sporulation protein YqfC [Sporolactobacillus sp.]
MKNWTGRLKKWFADTTGLPEDVVSDIPRISLIGRSRLSVENFLGVLSFTENNLVLKTSTGVLHVTGHSFVLEAMLPQELDLRGEIGEIRFEPDDGRVAE